MEAHARKVTALSVNTTATVRGDRALVQQLITSQCSNGGCRKEKEVPHLNGRLNRLTEKDNT